MPEAPSKYQPSAVSAEKNMLVKTELYRAKSGSITVSGPAVHRGARPVAATRSISPAEHAAAVVVVVSGMVGDPASVVVVAAVVVVALAAASVTAVPEQSGSAVVAPSVDTQIPPWVAGVKKVHGSLSSSSVPTYGGDRLGVYRLSVPVA